MTKRLKNKILTAFPVLKNEKFSKRVSYIVCILCFVITMAVSLKYFFPLDCWIIGDDSAYHYLRVDALFHKLKTHDFFNGGIDYLYCNGAGYASSTAYPDLFLYIPAFLRLIGINFAESMFIFVLLCSAASYFSMFFLVEKITGSMTGGSIAGILYTFLFYRMDNIYFRFALGEVEAYIFWPVVLLGLYDFIFKDFKKPYILCIGLSGMLMAHLISAAEALGVCVLVSLICLPRILKKPKKLIVLAASAGCTLALTAYFWIPLIEFLTSGEFTVSHPLWKSEDCTVNILDLFRDSKINGSGILFFILWLPRVFITHKSPVYQEMRNEDESDDEKPVLLACADVFMILGLIICFLITDKAPWKLLRYVLNFMQFPWRMYAPAGTLIVFSGAVYLSALLKHTNVKNRGLLAVLAISVLTAVVHMEPFEIGRCPIDDNYFTGERSFYVGVGEWYPCKAKENIDEMTYHSDKVITDNGNEIAFERHNGTLTFETGENEYQYADIPYICYKGYKATDSSGKELRQEMNDHGMIRVDLTDAAEGTVTVKHHLTPVRICAYILSALSVVFIALFFIKNLIKRKEKPDKK